MNLRTTARSSSSRGVRLSLPSSPPRPGPRPARCTSRSCSCRSSRAGGGWVSGNGPAAQGVVRHAAGERAEGQPAPGERDVRGRRREAGFTVAYVPYGDRSGGVVVDGGEHPVMTRAAVSRTHSGRVVRLAHVHGVAAGQDGCRAERLAVIDGPPARLSGRSRPGPLLGAEGQRLPAHAGVNRRFSTIGRERSR
jgi:hypothetical protein